MKTKIILILLMPLMGCEYYSNLKKEGCTDVICFINDETDTMIAFSRFESCKLFPSKLLSNSGFQNRNGLIVKFTSIKNVQLTEERVFNLNPSNGLKNKVERKSEIDSFRNSVNRYFCHSQKTYSTIGNSAVFEKLSSELDWLSKLKVDGKRELIVFSDLRQNIPNKPLNLYLPEDILTLKLKPELFDSIFLSAYPMPINLKGVYINFIYQPNTIEKDQIFLLIVQRLKGILESRGCEIEVSGSYF